MTKKMVAVFTALACGIAGLMLGAFAVKGLVAQQSARSWPTTAGTIRSAEVRTTNGRDGLSWCAHWTYEYSVNGKSYVGTRRTFGTIRCHKGQATAEKEARLYPTGTQVAVAYQPGSPSNATLRPTNESSFFWWFFALSAAALVLIAVGLLIQSRKLEADRTV